jgi:hypothetical protein
LLYTLYSSGIKGYPLSFLQLVENVQGGQYEGLIGLDYLTVHDHLVQHVVGLLDIIHDVQLANILEIFIQGLHQVMDKL